MKMTWTAWLLLGGACADLERPVVNADGHGLKARACRYQKGPHVPHVRLIKNCVDDSCGAVRYRTSPAGIAADWLVDGHPVATEACEVVLDVPVPGKRFYVTADMPTQTITELLATTHHSGGNPGDVPDIIAGGEEDDCLFWIASLGGCLQQSPAMVYRSKFDNGAQTVGPEFVQFDTNPRDPARTDYGDWFRWTPNGYGDLGMSALDTPPTNFPNDVSVEHWFALLPGQGRSVWAGHSYADPNAELVDKFFCDENGNGGMGGAP